MARYSKAFKAKAVARLLPPESATLEDVSAEMGVRADTLSRWRAEALSDSQDRLWTGPARLEAVIHTASLVHDDVIDEAEVRRGVATVNSDFGNRIAVLAGDFLFAQSSWYLANLDDLEVVKLLSEVIKHFAEGEILQSQTQFDPSISLETYLEKSFFKTASLMAGSSKAAARLSGAGDEVATSMYRYGRCLGISFQIIDDLLDFTSSTEALGKPVGSDLAQGNLTAPVLFALEEMPQLREVLERLPEDEHQLPQAVQWVRQSQGIDRSRQLAQEYAQQAADDQGGLIAGEGFVPAEGSVGEADDDVQVRDVGNGVRRPVALRNVRKALLSEGTAGQHCGQNGDEQLLHVWVPFN